MAEDEPVEDTDGDDKPPPEITAGIAAAPLLADPKSWIRRRVETIDMLAHEETHRRVSIDFALSPEQYDELTIDDGVVVPISVLTKERRRNFSLRDESGSAVPVLGKEQNGDLAHLALLNAAYDALPQHPPIEVLEMLSADMRQVVMLPPDEALDTLDYLYRAAESGDPWRGPIVNDPACRSLLWTLSQNYVLFAVLPPDGPARRILKYSYSEDFTGSVRPASRWLRLRLWLRSVFWLPDRRLFIIECPGAGRAASFHLEITTAEELRFSKAVLYYEDTGEAASSFDTDVNRASLYPPEPVDEFGLDAFVEVAPERTGATSQAAVTSLIVAALLWAGYLSNLDAAPEPAVSLLVGGAALFSGVSATRGEHRLVKRIFFWARFWLTVVTVAGLTASASLALEIPDEQPTEVWKWAAIVCTLAAVQRLWTAIRSPA